MNHTDFLEYAETLVEEYTEMKKENTKIKNQIHEICKIAEMREKKHKDDIDELVEFGKMKQEAIDELKKENEKLKKENEKLKKENEDETDYKIINKGKFNHEIKEAKKEKKVYDTPSEEEEEDIVDKVDNLLNQLKIPKGFVDDFESMCKDLKNKKLDDFSDEESEEEKEEEDDEESEEETEEEDEEEKTKKNNETMIREYLKERNITKFHHLQEKDLIDYSKLYDFFKIKTTPKCYIVKYYNIKSDLRDTTLKTLRFKKP